jgi:hypothetical protein
MGILNIIGKKYKRNEGWVGHAGHAEQDREEGGRKRGRKGKKSGVGM